MSPVFVIGHRNPDTDSICSAICYADLKRKLTGEEYIACRAGHVNAETQFVLEHFGVEPPRYIASFEPRLSDVPQGRRHRLGNVAAPRVGLHERKRHPDARGRR